MVKVFEDGRQVYDIPDLTEIVRYANKSKNEFWEEYKRLVNPHSYKVDLSEGLYNLKQQLLNDAK